MENRAHNWGVLLAELVMLHQQYETNQRRINLLRHKSAAPEEVQPILDKQKTLLWAARKVRRQMRNFAKSATAQGRKIPECGRLTITDKRARHQ